MLPTLLCSFAVFFLAVHLATLVVAWWRCRPGAARLATRERPGVTVVRPLCGIETFQYGGLLNHFATRFSREMIRLLFLIIKYNMTSRTSDWPSMSSVQMLPRYR